MTGASAEDGLAAVDALPCTNNALRRATRQLGALYDEAFAPTGLKGTQLLLMWRIAELGGEGGPTILSLSEQLAVGISALTHALRPLVRDGLVELRPDAQDRRSKRATLTALGRKRLDEGILLWSAANRRVETLLGPASAQVLRAIADQVASEEFASAFRSGLGGVASSCA
ncbi:transcriptional regulator, MarR family [Methylobacterium nodulans ORS 2060]|uniref:Transcriptional regulator, MarR family n=2 Tax=Methylobacterium nodulans TaxID=114616 RepID=B8IC42_METNO|nr:transcriptional regulator, MarR family [Methylobacterium nodulans ORS 2060]